MAQVKSISDGYINETGVMSAAVGSTVSALILHRVLIRSSIQLKGVSCSNATAGGPTGFLGVTPAGATLTITGASVPVRLKAIATVATIPSAPSVPGGGHG